MNTIPVGELLYEYTVKLTGMTDYGIPFDAILAGNISPPPEGARFDIPFEGDVRGAKWRGKIRGVDYLRVRADGRFELHLHAQVGIDDGARIALFGNGVALLREESPIADLRENVTLSTSFQKYASVNRLQVWATGTADLLQQTVQIKGYIA